mgnify:CR=1 FL=1
MKISIGSFIDQLSIINIRIWMAENIKRNPEVTDKAISDACRITNDANKQRNDLIEEIDKYFGIENHQGSNKMYGQ